MLLFVAAMLLIIGLIRPGFVVFWRERKSRTSVLAVWGTATAILALICVLYSGPEYKDQKEQMQRNEAAGSGPTAPPAR